MKKLLLSIATILALQFCFNVAFAFGPMGLMPSLLANTVAASLDDQQEMENTVDAAQIEGVGYFASIKDAVAAASNGDVIKILQDCQIDTDTAVNKYLVTVDNKDITIDLNGKKVTVTAEKLTANGQITAVFFITNGGKLRMIDSADVDGKVDVDAYGVNNVYGVAYIFRVDVGCTLIMDGGSYKLGTPVGADIFYYSSTNLIVNGGDYEMIVGSGNCCIFNGAQYAGKALVTGGTFNADPGLINTVSGNAGEVEYNLGYGAIAPETDGGRWTIGRVAHLVTVPEAPANTSWKAIVDGNEISLVDSKFVIPFTAESVAINLVATEGYLFATDVYEVEILNSVEADIDLAHYDLPEVVQFKAFIGDVGYETLQEAINDVKDGEEIILAEDCSENVSIAQVSNLKFTINGDNKTMTGKITITGVVVGKISDSIGLTIKNVNFASESTIKHIFIEGNKNNYYPCNITVEKCSFTGPSSDSVIVPISVKHAQNFKMIDCEVTGVDSLFQSSGNGYNCTFLRCEVANSGRGINLNSVYGEVLIEDCVISALSTKYGIRVDGTAATGYDITIKNSSIDAFIPVCVRKASKNGTITFEGENTITARNTDGIWCAIGTSEYETNGTMPTAPTGQVVVTLNDSGLSMDGVYGNYVAPSQEDGYDTIISTNFGNLTTEEVASVKAKLATLGEAVGGQDKVTAYFATVYGANKVDATKFAATTLALFKISECFALPLLENEPSVSIGKIETVSGAVGFEFTIMDGQDAVAIIDNLKTKKLIKYVEQLANGFEYNDEQVAIVLDVNNKKIKATFADMSKLSGFMKVDFSVPEAQ